MNSLPLEEVANIFSGNSINAKLKKDKYTDKNFPTSYVATKDLSKNGDFEYNNGVTIPDAELGNFKIAPKGSTLICMEGGSAGKKIGLVDKDVCFVNKLGALVPNEKINSKYLYYSLQTVGFQAQFQSSLTGVIGGVSLSKLKKLKIPVPSLQEQEKIVERLDTFVKIKSNLITNTQMKHAKLDKFYDFNFSDINEFVNLEDLILQIQYGTSKKSASEGEYPVLGMGNLDTRGVINLSKLKYSNDIEELHKYKLEKGDVLFNRTNSAELVGKSAVFNIDKDCIFAGYLIKIKCDPNKLNSHYLTMFLNSKFGKILHEKFRTQSTGQANISGSKLKKYKIPYVEIDVQNEIVKKRERLLNKVDSIEKLIQSQQELLESLNKSMFNKEFSYE